MATKEKEKPSVDVMETISKAEHFIEKNRKSLLVIGLGVVACVGGYFVYQNMYIDPNTEEAQKAMWVAEKYFKKDSLDKAMRGDGRNKGFIDIADEYSMTRPGNLAHYYLGICYIRKGKYEDAIRELEKFDSNDQMLAPIAAGAIGDADMELGKTDDAVSSYVKAAEMSKNSFTTPIFLMKAGQVYESLAKYKDAISLYERIKSDYPESREGRDIDKYIARAKTLAGMEL